MFNFNESITSEALSFFGAKCTDAERAGILERYGVSIEPGESHIQAIAAVVSAKKSGDSK